MLEKGSCYIYGGLKEATRRYEINEKKTIKEGENFHAINLQKGWQPSWVSPKPRKALISWNSIWNLKTILRAVGTHGRDHHLPVMFLSHELEENKNGNVPPLPFLQPTLIAVSSFGASSSVSSCASSSTAFSQNKKVQNLTFFQISSSKRHWIVFYRDSGSWDNQQVSQAHKRYNQGVF